MEATIAATNPLVYYAGAGNQSRNYLSMRCIEKVGNQELADALQIQGNLIGNLEHEKARMTAQFNLLDRELSRRAQRGNLAKTAGTPGTAGVGEGGAAGGTGATDAGGRGTSPTGSNSEDSGDGNRRSVSRTRSRRERSPSATREPAAAADAARATTMSPREQQAADKAEEGTASGSRELSARGSERRHTGNAGSVPVSASPYRDVRLTEGERTGNREMPEPPRGIVHPSSAPLDLGDREPNASTVYVGNIHRDASELEVLELFNSAGGVYGNREPNIVVAVNFVYYDGNFRGQAYLLYSTVALANFVVRRMHDRELRRRMLWVRISDYRFNTANIGRRGNVLGNSRGGARIWDCAPARRTHPRD